MNYDYYKLKEKNRSRLLRMYRRRAAHTMTREQFYDAVDRMIRQQERIAESDLFGTGFLADMATDRLRASGLSANDDLWPWIAREFRISWSDYYGNARIQNAVGLACIRVFKLQPDACTNN